MYVVTSIFEHSPLGRYHEMVGHTGVDLSSIPASVAQHLTIQLVSNYAISYVVK